MVVRMRETRLICHGPQSVDMLRIGIEYDLPAAFAAFLILDGKADWMGGRLRKFAPKEICSPTEKKRVPLSVALENTIGPCPVPVRKLVTLEE